MPVSTCPPTEQWRLLQLGVIPVEQVEELTSHLEQCPACGETINTLNEVDSLMQAVRGDTPRTAPRVDRLIAQLKGWVTSPTSARRLPVPGAEELGQLGEYRLVRLLGSGGMGAVYLAQHSHVSRPVALKIVHGHARPTAEELARFRREAEVVGRLRHPGIVQLYEANEHDGRAYFAMEYVAGGSLAQVLAERVLPPADAAHLVAALADGVQAAHDAGVIHRDLKPGNVLLCSRVSPSRELVRVPEGRDHIPKITDFGLAKEVGDGEALTQPGAVLGTPGYMAPEQAVAGGVVGAQADVYSLGAILYECLTGRPPFRAATPLQTLDQLRTREPAAPRQLNAGVPRDLETICLKCLRKEPVARYATAAELAADLRRFLDGAPIAARPVGHGERLVKWARRRPGIAALLGVCCACVVTVIVGGVRYEQRLRDALAEARAEGTKADENYRSARGALQKILFRTRDARWNALPLLQQLRREQVEDALRYYEEVAGQTGDDPRVRKDVAWAALEAGKFQVILGRMKDGIASVRRALELTDGLPRDAATRMLRGDALVTLGMYTTGDDALRNLEDGVAEFDRLVADDPTDAGAQEHLAGALITHGGALRNLGQDKRALPVMLRAVDVCTTRLQAAPKDLDRRRALARARVNLTAVYRHLPDHDKMREQHRLAEDELEKLLALDAFDRPTIDGLAVLRINGAYDLEAAGKRSDAVAYLRQNLPMLEAALKAEPNDAGYRVRLYATHGLTAMLHQSEKQYAEAAAAWERAVGYTGEDRESAARADLVGMWLQATDHARAAAEAQRLRDCLTRKPDSGLWKRLAGYYDQMATQAAADKALTPEHRQDLPTRYRASAQAARQEARAAEARESKP